MYLRLCALVCAAVAGCGQNVAQRSQAPEESFEQQRLRMVDEDIAARGVKNPAVLESMRKTPRHLLVPPAYRHAAYADQPLPIGKGQTISQPYIVAAMTELLEPAKQHRVLEIGTGSGYQAAVLSPLVAEVHTIEVVEELALSAKKALEQLGYRNVFVTHGDGYKGLPDKAPFDRIILTAAPPEIPQALLDQLEPGGKLVAPIGTGVQNLVVIDKDEKGQLKRRTVMGVRFVPMVPQP